MHLPIRRGNKRTTSLSKAAPSPPETSGTPGTVVDSLPHNSLPAIPSAPQVQQPQSPPHGHGLKGIGRRMTSFSKPVRMLKSMASRGSLHNHGKEGSHGRLPSMSTASIRSSSSLHEASSMHEPNVKVKERVRESLETDYGKEVTSQADVRPEARITPALALAEKPAGDKEKRAEGEQAVQAVEGTVHEAAARQEHDAVVVEKAETKQEPQTRIEQVADVHDAPAAGAVVEDLVADAKDVENVATDAEDSTRAPKEEVLITASEPEPELAGSAVLVPLHVQDATISSLSSSSTSVEPAAAAENTIKSNGDAVGQVKMEEPEQIKSTGANVNPFLVDDPEGPLSEPESQKGAASSPDLKNDESIVLSRELESAKCVTQPPASVAEENQSAPAPAPEKSVAASSDNAASPMSSSTEDEAPELHVPALTVTSLFLPVPQTDPLSALLTKYVPEPHLRPPRDTSGEWQHTDFHTLVMTNNWRALASMARDRILTSNPRDVELVLNPWYIRLSSLARLRLFNQASAECENLFSVLATIEPPTARTYVLRNVLPFELDVFRARCAYWAGDHLGYLDDVSVLLHRCRLRARQAHDDAERAMWKERGARMALIVASQLVEMKDYMAAASLLQPLSLSGSSAPSPALQSAIARIHLQGGNLGAAAALFDLVDADSNAEPSLKAMNAAVRSAAEGDWAKAAEFAREILQNEPGDVVAANNCAVALLGQGKIKEAIEVLEATLQVSPSAVTTTEPYLFNLSTMYELRAGLTSYRKRDLLIEVAKWSGDGLRAACLKMNA